MKLNTVLLVIAAGTFQLLSGCGDSVTKKTPTQEPPVEGCTPECEEGFTCLQSECVETQDPDACEEDEEYNEMLQVCLVPSCTNGIKDSAEEGPDCGGPCEVECSIDEPSCDDGVRNGDEIGVDCGGSCEACEVPATCGNDTIEASEDCDHGGTLQLNCAYGETSCQVCSASCTWVAGTVSGFCGDSSVQAAAGEECDTGQNITTECAYGETSCDVCNASCRLVPGSTRYCGDGVRQNNEACDGNDLNGSTCTSLGEPSGTLRCSSSCNFDTSDCQAQTTGPVPVTLSVGYSHTCTVMDDDSVRCWGENTDGRIGDGTRTQRTTPTLVPGLQAEYVVAGGYHTCALLLNGTVSCWGSNLKGQVGVTTTGDVLTPTPVAGLTNITAIDAGTGHVCALTANGDVYCWGDAEYGQTGYGSLGTFSSTPIRVTDSNGFAISNVTQISAGLAHTCARHADGTISCWGRNDYNQLGRYPQTTFSQPYAGKVYNSAGSVVLNAQYVGVGGDFTCFRNGSSISCWGGNVYGQLGLSDTLDRPYPSNIFSSLGFLNVGERHACSSNASRELFCWGSGQDGRLGTGSTLNQSSPTFVSLSANTTFDVGGTHTCALLQDGSLQCWGRNHRGQLGIGSTINASTPTPVTF